MLIANVYQTGNRNEAVTEQLYGGYNQKGNYQIQVSVYQAEISTASVCYYHSHG